MTVCLANLVNFIACLILYVSDLQVQLQTPLQIGLNMGVICVKLVISVSVAVKFVRDPVVFDYFRFSFNER
jgi:hypothetical protein